MDEDLYQKNTITRSYSRKINLGNFEMVDIFESRTIVLPRETTILEFHQASQDLKAIVEADVEADAHERKKHLGIKDGDWDAFRKVIESVSEFKPFLVSDFEKLDEYQKSLVNEVKKAYKRSPAFKERSTNSDIENERNRK